MPVQGKTHPFVSPVNGWTPTMEFMIKIVILPTSILLGYLVYWGIERHKKKEAQKIADQLLEEASKESLRQERSIKEKILREIEQKQKSSALLVEELNESNANLSKKLDIQERELEYHLQKIEYLEKNIAQKSAQLGAQTEEIELMKKELSRIKGETQDILLSRSGYTKNQAEAKFLKDFEETVLRESEAYNNRYLQYISAHAEKTAGRILSAITNRCQFVEWNDVHPCTIQLPDRGGVREEEVSESFLNSLSEALEIDLEYNPSSNEISLITADSCKREIGRQVLEKIIGSRNYSLSDLFSLIQECKEAMENEVLETGKKACRLLGIQLSDGICKLLGRLKYRTSFGQNVLAHSLEVSCLAMLIASEIGLDPVKACRAGLLHDIGKALDHEQEGGHPEIGAKILKEIEEDCEVIEGVLGHHEDIQMATPYATIINTADAISASRPGARRETFEKYIKRLEKLESIAYRVSGIENAFAISAGREIRVIVNPEKVADHETNEVAKQIAKAVEEDLHYPGKIKITVIREMKVVEYAK